MEKVDRESKFFISALACYINEEKTEVDLSLNFDKIISISRNQQLGTFIYTQLKPNFIEICEKNQNVKKLQEINNFCIFNYTNRISVLERIEKEFTKNNIDFLVFKGTEISKYLKNSYQRMMGDSDILVKPSSREKADKVLKELGFANKNKGPNEWIYKNKNFEIELHHNLQNEEEETNTKELKKFYNEVWNYAKKSENSTKYQLDINYHFVYLITHLYKHFINSGVGFRQFFDLAILVKTGLLDFSFIEEKLKEINLFDFAKKCFSLVEKWFNVKIKIDKEEISEEFNSEAINLLMNNGVFGFNDNGNKNNYIIYQIIKNKKISKSKKILQYIFPPYRLIKEIPYYSFVNGKPFLMPIAWIYRVFRMIFLRKTKDSIKSIKQVSNISNEQIEKRLETLKKWGI